MSKFKVGDRVKLVSMKGESPWYKEYLNKTFTIERINDRYVEVKEITKDPLMPYLKNLELVNKKYTYENLKQSPIGTKITLESGNIIIKVKENYYCNNLYFRNDNDLKGLKDTISLNKIIKIEEPIYTTVYEKKEILDEVEKRYLRDIIRPFRNKVKSIKKTDNYMNGTKNQYITITYKDDYSTDFPNFRPNTMYKGMEEYKEYTLEELGL